MSIPQAEVAPAIEDDTIAALNKSFEAQRRAFAGDRNPSLEVRRERVGAIIGMMMANRDRMKAALVQDFGAHPGPAADLLEILGVVGRAQYVLANLETWMAPEEREADPASLGTATVSIQRQPKGVIGNIVPWNFPFDIGVGPLTEMLAAGNRVIIKPSEHAPTCSALLAEMVAATWDPEVVTVAVGGLELARAFSALPFDHLMYTGSTDIGRQIMTAAAQNLTPVTLELGGKCPALMTPGSVTPVNVESVLGTKLVKNGQMCVTVDYALVQRAEAPAFVEQARAFMAQQTPGYAAGGDCTGVITTRHYDRLTGLLAEARAGGAEVVTLDDEGAGDAHSRRMPMALVLDAPADSRLMREEIFGPILPVVVYDQLDEAVAAINAGDRPLGLYVFGDDRVTVDRVLAGTHSGGAAVNTCAIQAALPQLAFGGSGASGMGRHHGIEGFREFSNPRGVVVRGEGDMIAAFYPPYAKAEAVVNAMLGG